MLYGIAMTHRITAMGLGLIKDSEGYRSESYQDSAGVWTIGYGHTGDVTPGQVIDQAEADRLLLADVAWAEDCVNSTVSVDLDGAHFDALVSFVFNVGCGAFKNSTLLRKLNAGGYAAAAAEFDRWVHAGGKRLRGLEIRRAKERRIFEEGTENLLEAREAQKKTATSEWVTR